MENRGKNGWWLPVVLAIGAVLYHLACRKHSSSLKERREELLRRLCNGATPRTLLEEGFSAAELIDARVPQEAVRSVVLASSSTFAQQTLRGKRCDGPSNTSGVPSLLCHLLLGSRWTKHVGESDAKEDTRSQNKVATTTDTHKATHSNTAYSVKGPPTRQHQLHAKISSRRSGNSLTQPPLQAQPLKVQSDPHDTYLTERRTATHRSVGAIRVQVAALSGEITSDYMLESTSYNHPLEIWCFLHADGTRLSIVAEDCSAVESNAVQTTETYVKCSLARAQALAEAADTILKVNLLVAARKIATTVMDLYLSTSLGTPPVTLDAFFLFQDSIAYVIQLQTCTDAYEERLSDLLYAVQSARLHSRAQTRGIWSRSPWGRNEYHVSVEGTDRVYVVEAPVDVVVRASTAAHAARSELTFAPRGSDGSPQASWNATATVLPSTSHDQEEDNEKPYNVISLLRDANVSVELTWHMAVSASADPSSPPPLPPPPLAAVTARVAIAKDTGVFNAVYRSPYLSVPLPSPEHFATEVREHPYETSLTFFITPANTSELFELEVHSMRNINDNSLGQLWSHIETLLLAPVHLQHSTNAAGQACFYVEGLAASSTKMKLWIGGAQLSEERWLCMRWLHEENVVMPRELERYRSDLLERTVC